MVVVFWGVGCVGWMGGDPQTIHTHIYAHTYTYIFIYNTDLNHRPAHLALAQALLAVRLDEGGLAQEHARDGGEVEEAREGEEEDEAVHCFDFCVLGLVA